MGKRETISKIFGIALVFLLVALMFGGKVSAEKATEDLTRSVVAIESFVKREGGVEFQYLLRRIFIFNYN